MTVDPGAGNDAQYPAEPVLRVHLQYTVFGILLSPIVAAIAMSLSSVPVIANALRLRALRLEA